MAEKTFSAMGCEIVVAAADDRWAAAIVGCSPIATGSSAGFARQRAQRVNGPRPAIVVSAEFAAMHAPSPRARRTGRARRPHGRRRDRGAGYTRLRPAVADPLRPYRRPPPGWRARRAPGADLESAGCELDLNGVVKAMTVDDRRAPRGPGFVSAGGDLAGTRVAVGARGRRGGLGRARRDRDQRDGEAPVATGGEIHHTGRPGERPFRRDAVEAGHGVGRTCVAADVAAGPDSCSAPTGRSGSTGAGSPRGSSLGREDRRERPLGGGLRGAGVGLTSDPIAWYVIRASGIVAYLLLTAVVGLGVSMAGRAPGSPGSRGRGSPSRTSTGPAASSSAASSASTC